MESVQEKKKRRSCNGFLEVSILEGQKYKSFEAEAEFFGVLYFIGHRKMMQMAVSLF